MPQFGAVVESGEEPFPTCCESGNALITIETSEIDLEVSVPWRVSVSGRMTWQQSGFTHQEFGCARCDDVLYIEAMT